jgi:hypothetical protein
MEEERIEKEFCKLRDLMLSEEMCLETSISSRTGEHNLQT